MSKYPVMTEQKPYYPDQRKSEISYKEAVGPAGKQLTLHDLPPPGTQRWVARRKAEVVAGVRGGLISLEEACHRYNLSVDEFRSWQRLLESHGIQGLRTTRTKKYRQRPKRPDTKPNAT